MHLHAALVDARRGRDDAHDRVRVVVVRPRAHHGAVTEVALVEHGEVKETADEERRSALPSPDGRAQGPELRHGDESEVQERRYRADLILT